MKRDGTPITFAAVARSAKVSQWLVYADGVREYIEAARVTQAAEPAQAKRAGAAPARQAFAPTSSWRSRTTAGFALRWAALRRLYGNDLVLNSKPRRLSRSGAESMKSPQLTIATGAKTLCLQQNSMMRVPSSAQPKIPWRPRAQS